MEKQNRKPKAVFVVGPTALGKSAAAIEIAKKFNGVIISADSMQIYRGLDIGTAKESPENRKNIPHELIDVVSPDEEFSVALFKEKAFEAMRKAWASGKLPVVAGGTGLYIESLIRPMSFAQAAKDDNIRNRLKIELEQFGAQSIYDRLKSVDEETALKLHPNDTKRVLRALEIYEMTGKTKSQSKDEDYYMQNNAALEFEYLIFMPEIDRPLLYERINKRVDDMIECGLLNEIKKVLKALSLIKSGLASDFDNILKWINASEINDFSKYAGCFDYQSMQAIGYKEFKTYNGANLSEIVELIKKNTRNYAKRQLTWFKRYKEIICFPIGEMERVYSKIQSFLE